MPPSTLALRRYPHGASHRILHSRSHALLSTTPCLRATSTTPLITTAAGSPPHTRAFSTTPRRTSAWAAVASVATNMAANAAKRAIQAGSPASADLPVHPLKVLAKELSTRFLAPNIKKLVASRTPQLDRVAKYYTQSEGKYVRPRIVLLMARATALCPKAAGPSVGPISIDQAISPATILTDINPSYTTTSTPPSSSSSPSPSSTQSQTPAESIEATLPGVNPSQRRLAEITETIHTASLLHDDVIDVSETRRGAPSANLEFGNKMAVLGGDFLLARASVALARLRHPEVTELLATVIANLVEGEFMQLRNTASGETTPKYTDDVLAWYLEKTYLKTASLISKSCRATAILGGVDAVTVDAAYAYGKNLGLAFQLVDDMLDYTTTNEDLGKPAGADLELGLATAPLLFAWKANPELGELVGRKFSWEGDVQKAREFVIKSDGIEQTRALAESYASKAAAALDSFPDSDAKEGLLQLTRDVLKRKK